MSRIIFLALLGSAATSALAQPPSAPPPRNDIFAKMDADKDGRVTAKEWTDGGGAADRFAFNDLNKDGLVTAPETQAVQQAVSAAMKITMDADKDGAVSPEEMRAFMSAPVQPSDDVIRSFIKATSSGQ